VIAGRVWKFGDDINVEMMLPQAALYLPDKDRNRYVFQAHRPGWVEQVRPGDFIVGGRNYGIGSSRPAPLSLRNVGIACLIVESATDVFFRNAVNFGLLTLQCPGVHSAFAEGQTAEVSTDDFTVRNRETGVVLQAERFPKNLVALMLDGGVFPQLEREGLIAPAP
jgi:3-isopropylmalate/(R)-2-methylmalate dehydratase small subunit